MKKMLYLCNGIKNNVIMETNKQWKRVPFDIELAKKIQAGEIEGRIVTKNGWKANILSFDINNTLYPIAAIIYDQALGCEQIHPVQENGQIGNCPSTYTNSYLFIELPEETPKHEFKPFDKVLVKVNEKWHPDIFLEYTWIKGKLYAQLVTHSYYLISAIIPYEGNEHLVGTTNNSD